MLIKSHDLYNKKRGHVQLFSILLKGIIKACQTSKTGFFCKIRRRLSVVNYFRKKLHLTCLTEF